MHGLSRFLSGHLSIAHALPRSPTHIVPSRSRGDLSITKTSSLPPHASMPSMCPSRPFFCWPDLYWTCATGVSLSVANNHTLAIFVYLLASLLHLGDACMICSHKKRKKHTHTLSLSNLSFVVTFSFTHILFLHTYSFSFTRT